LSSRNHLVLLLTLGLLAHGSAAWAQSEETGEAAPGSAAGSASVNSFQASLNAGGGGVRSIDLSDNGNSSASARVGLNLIWTIKNPLTNLFGTLNPFYNEVFADSSFSTYGASAGLGWSRRTSPRRIWRLNSRFSYAPDQDIPRPRTSETLDAPTVRQLVPRNGFIALDVDGGVDMKLTENMDLGISGSLSSRRFDVVKVATAEGQAAYVLVDQRNGGASADWSMRSSPRNSWSVSSSARLIGLGDDPSGSGQGEDTRLQVDVAGGFNHILSRRATLSVQSGYSAIDTGGGNSGSTPTMNVSWAWSGEHVASNLTLNRNQGIFIGSTAAVDTTNLAGNMAWEGRNQGLSFLAGYSLSRRSGQAISGGDSRSRNLTVSYNRQARRWGWFASLFNFRQNSDADFAGALVSTGGALGLSWNIGGVRS